ncbi:putative uncharacterized protein [Waddlia chondrophila 2032/99]|uniref:Uncharacterized protein n=2 Tax=Waddlia chondrophila TaxID=71667 RepID=D6YTC3_WADCW|nr:hypothetical protein [Waddlia chondrophila]ADI37384.1 hypothetical protein wcw_0007 [Waddlia chondrophila WSU 86-1044]CCB91626.1 putative uncharacterized protein [Waddlia chondrophila 2032/99]
MDDGLDDYFDEDFGFLDEYDREMMEFVKGLKSSGMYEKLSESTRLRIDLMIKAYDGDDDLMILLSEMCF